ncbi:cell surface protein, partial [Neisseria dentiae]
MYDHVQFHTDENYPAGLPPENAATHIGMYWAWAASQSLTNPVWQSAPETAADFAAMLEGGISGAEFLRRHMDGALTRDDFNDFGQRFTDFYYDDEEDGYGAFMEDYVRTMNTPALDSF